MYHIKINISLFGAIFCLFFMTACAPPTPEAPPVKNIKIAFGSCGSQDHPLPIFNEVVKHQADYFIFLGDNIYGDSYNMDTINNKYGRLAEKSSYQNLKSNTKILATWDDHDFGWNDSGRHYPFKEQTKEIFLDFFEEPKDSERRKRAGIYDSHLVETDSNRVQIILLDTRTFRDDMIHRDPELEKERRYFYYLDYTPHTSSDSTLLGSEQWNWLDQQLQVEADVRIVASSTQFGIEYNGYEAWANFPHEQERFFNLIKKNKANGLLFISGDVHYAEISKMEPEGLYPIYDVTASGLSSTWHFATPNDNRIEGPIMDNHFGLLTLKLQNELPLILMEVFDVTGNQRIEYEVPLSDLHF